MEVPAMISFILAITGYGTHTYLYIIALTYKLDFVYMVLEH